MAKATESAAKAAKPAAKQAPARKELKGPVVKVKLVRSGIGTPKDQRATLQGLGLKRMNQERSLQDTPTVRGLIFKVRHLVEADPPARRV